MGRPPLPAPTDISTSALGTSDDLLTDISRVTDRTSYSIPEDGSPVTITTKKIRGGKAESQTSLLIEYFEGSKVGDGVRPRPSVRVRVTPSGSKKKREGDHIQITETGKHRIPSYTRRISLPQNYEDPLLPSELSDTSSGRPPVEVEVLHGTSDFTQYRDQSPSRYIVPPSDISSMPPESTIDGSTFTAPAIVFPYPRSTSLDRNRRAFERNVEMDGLKAPSRHRSRSLSKERLVQSAAKKVHERSAGTVRDSSGKQKMASRRSSGSSTREFIVDEEASPKSRSRRYRDDERLGVEQSEISALSNESGKYSTRSGASGTSSINNPKLLSAVEDAIKRLILPELNAVKEEQARQKNRLKFEDITRDSMAPAGSRENLRRVSKSSSSPNVGKSTVVIDDADTIKGKKSRQSSRGSEKSHETAIREESSRRKSSGEKKHSTAKVVAAGLVGAGLTAAALRHHDSIQDLNEEREERRKRRSKSRNRSASISGSIDETVKVQRTKAGQLGIPPMPLQSSAMGTDLTRDSIMSAETSRPRSPSDSESYRETKLHEVQEVSRGAPRQVISPTPRTPTRKPADIHSRSPASIKNDKSGSGKTKAAALAAAAGIGAAIVAHEHENDQHNRPYSPIDSPGYRDNIAEHDRVRSLKSGENLSGRKVRHHKSNSSMEALALAGIPNSKQRPAVSLEPGYDVLPEEPYSPDGAQAGNTEQWLEREHETNERLRREYEEESQLGSERRQTMYTEDSYMDEYGDKSFDAAQDIRDVGANPEYVHTPVAVESAVASLHEPSILSSVHSSHKTDSVHDEFGNEYRYDDLSRDGKGSFDSQNGGNSRERWEAIRDQAIAHARQQTSTASPRQSDASYDDRPVMGASAIPLAGDAMPAIGHGFDDESDVTTNPSIIKGPIGGLEHGDRSHWPYDPTPAMPNRDSSVHEDHTTRDAALALGAGAAGVGLGLAAARSRDSSKRSLNNARETSFENIREEPWQKNHSGDQIPGLDGAQRFAGGYTSPAGKGIDEGYQSGAIQGGDVTPDPYAQNRAFDNASLDEEDPFTTQKHLRHASGLSHGMESPLYDAATGKGIDRIRNRDIVALMDHLTVRDAARNARDTDILITLVRNAADMRNNMEDMKKLIQEHDKMVMTHTDRAADKTVQRMLGGPRPLPTGQSKGPRRMGSDETDVSGKARKNVFRRALKSLSSKNTQDLSKIEGMLMQLLDEVEDLKNTQTLGGSQPAQDNTRSNSVGSYENMRANTDPGYEPEGQAGTSSSPAQSGHLSNPSSKHIGTMHSGYDIRRTSDGHRISTVMEGDEEEDEWTPQSAPANSSQRYDDDRMLTPTQEARRGQSVPLDTPPGQRLPLQTSRSAEETPKTEKSRKHKSGASSIFSAIPKISRWSKTTSSTVPDDVTIRNSTQKNRPYSQHSRSGSNLHIDDYDQYDLNQDDRLGSRTSLDKQARAGGAQPRSPSPLIPEQRLSLEDPKYQAHRNSLNLQHPQPRPGPTHRHQTYLETQALDFENPPTPDAADQWGNTPALALNKNINLNRFSGSSGQAPTHGELSPVHSEDDEDAYSDHSASEQAHNRLPPRPPKEPMGDDGPLVPPTAPVGFGYQSPYSNSGMHIASPLEPIEEVRYSLETDRSSVRNQLTPSPRPTAMQSAGRKITGPREMPQSARRVSSSGRDSPASLKVPRKPVAEQSREKSPVPSMESYRSSIDSETF